MKNELIAVGEVHSLCINGSAVSEIEFSLEGPVGDVHAGFSRRLSGHDGGYIRTSSLQKGGSVFNWRSWTAISREEIAVVEEAIGYTVPQGCLLENITFQGISDFSKLDPATRIVFPKRDDSQLILAVWEWNGPCRVVGDRFADFHQRPELKKQLISEAQGKRGVMGFVLSPGRAIVGDSVELYPRVY